MSDNQTIILTFPAGTRLPKIKGAYDLSASNADVILTKLAEMFKPSMLDQDTDTVQAYEDVKKTLDTMKTEGGVLEIWRGRYWRKTPKRLALATIPSNNP